MGAQPARPSAWSGRAIGARAQRDREPLKAGPRLRLVAGAASPASGKGSRGRPDAVFAQRVLYGEPGVRAPPTGPAGRDRTRRYIIPSVFGSQIESVGQ